MVGSAVQRTHHDGGGGAIHGHREGARELRGGGGGCAAAARALGAAAAWRAAGAGGALGTAAATCQNRFSWDAESASMQEGGRMRFSRCMLLLLPPCDAFCVGRRRSPCRRHGDGNLLAGGRLGLGLQPLLGRGRTCAGGHRAAIRGQAGERREAGAAGDCSLPLAGRGRGVNTGWASPGVARIRTSLGDSGACRRHRQGPR